MTNAQKVNWISLVGAPNVGKSTLLNALIGEKVSIVTPKPQTTRNLIKGVKIIENTQMIFTDSPGIFQSKNRAGQIMVKAAWQCIESADQVCLIVDATKHSHASTMFVMKELKARSCKYSLVINKIDLLPKPELLVLITFFQAQDEFKNIFLISALKQDGLDGLLKFFLETAHYAPWPFDQEQVTDAPLQFLISEIIREKIFMNTHEEVPYNLSVEVLSIKEERGITFIHADILVRDQSHKKILIGSKGNMLKKIGMAARCALESTFHKKFCLYTNVKVGSAKNETSGDKYGT